MEYVTAQPKISLLLPHEYSQPSHEEIQAAFKKGEAGVVACVLKWASK